MATRRDRKRVPVAMPQLETAPERWLRGIRVSGFTFTVLALLVLAVVVLAPGLKTLVEQRNEIAQLEAEVQQQRESVESLDEEIARWEDPAYIEAQARERLYYVYPGEYSYIIKDDPDRIATPDGAPISAELETTEVDWLATTLSTIFAAGLSDAVPDELVAPVIEDGR